MTDYEIVRSAIHTIGRETLGVASPGEEADPPAEVIRLLLQRILWIIAVTIRTLPRSAGAIQGAVEI
jgi:hypothetical protein